MPLDRPGFRRNQPGSRNPSGNPSPGGFPLANGRRGAAVRDLQDRLAALHFLNPDHPGTFGSGTERAVAEFQRGHGLPIDGICDRQTWNALVEAGRVLGERLLFFRNQRLRGEDIASLQRQLGSLGFDAGRVDGIFGPQTLAALSDFQRNAGLVEDGICGPATIVALRQIKTHADGGDVVAGVRERLWLQERPRTLAGRCLAVGEGGGLAVLAEAIRRDLVLAGAHAVGLHEPDPSAQASQANAAAAEAYVGLELLPDNEAGCQTVFYLGHNGFYSPAGRHLAELAENRLTVDLKLPDRGVQGLRLPILRQTRMPAIVVRVSPLTQLVQQPAALARSLTGALSAWAAEPLPG